MRKPMTIRIDTDLLAATKARARRDNRTVTNYIETVLRRELGLMETPDEVEMYAPPDVRRYRAIAKPGETKREAALARRAFKKILDHAGY